MAVVNVWTYVTYLAAMMGLDITLIPASADDLIAALQESDGINLL